MGWLARVIVPSTAVVFVGCAAIANFGDTETTTGEQNPSSSGTPSKSGTTSGMTSGMTSGTTSGSPADSGSTSGDSAVSVSMEAGGDSEPMCPAPKRPIGEACNAPQDCCSNACASNHQCKASCKIINVGCTPGSADCCLGEYCSVPNFSRCTACHADGTSPETISGVAIEASCCSNHVDALGKCNP